MEWLYDAETETPVTHAACLHVPRPLRIVTHAVCLHVPRPLRIAIAREGEPLLFRTVAVDSERNMTWLTALKSSVLCTQETMDEYSTFLVRLSVMREPYRSGNILDEDDHMAALRNQCPYQTQQTGKRYSLPPVVHSWLEPY